MEVILDELKPLEFFSHGGVSIITVIDDKFIKEYGIKKKNIFYDYKKYVRFFGELYLNFMHRNPNLLKDEVYESVNSIINSYSFIGNFIYDTDLKYDGVKSYEIAKFYYTSEKSPKQIQKRNPFGITNVNFTRISENDRRWDELMEQRLDHGFDESELWSLDGTIAKFIYPRLVEFKLMENRFGQFPDHLQNMEEWNTILDEMIEGFRLLADDGRKSERELEIENTALKRFVENFSHLWL